MVTRTIDKFINKDRSTRVVQAIEVNSVDEFLWVLDLAQDHWCLDTSWRPVCRWVFRGHGDHSWKLVPSAWRNDTGSDGWKMLDALSLIQDAIEIDGEHQQWHESPRFHSVAELNAIRAFIELADEVGHSVPDAHLVPNIDELQALLSSRPPNHQKYLVPTVPMALAQHHKVPTRLIDFSHNPLVAAFFAATSCISSSVDTSDRLEVWACDIGSLPRSIAVDEVLGYYSPPRSLVPYLHAQSGGFLWIGPSKAEEFFSHNSRWPDFSEIFTTPGMHIENDWDRFSSGLFKRISLPTKLAEHLIEALWFKRISHAHLMPGYDSVSKSLEFMFVRDRPVIHEPNKDDQVSRMLRSQVRAKRKERKEQTRRIPNNPNGNV